MFFVHGLPRDMSVLIVEKGKVQDHANLVAKGFVNTEAFAQDNRSAHKKSWVAHTMFGGNSNCWWGQTPRFHPNDFRLHSMANKSRDWPLTYEDLEQAYVMVEEMMEVSGGGSDHILPRSRAFPYPPHIPANSDTALRSHDSLWVAAPTARSNGGRRAICCANGVCDRCPIDAKFTVLNSVELFQRPRVALLMDTEVRAVSVEAGVARKAMVRHKEAEVEIAGSLFALAANGIFNAAILMRSGIRSPALGRYLHEQVSKLVLVDVPARNYFGGTAITGHGYQFYHDVDRSAAAAVLIENINAPASVRLEKGRWTDRIKLKLIAEDIPNSNNRVLLRDDEPFLEWNGHSGYAEAGIDRALTSLDRILPWEIEGMEVSGFAATEAHIQGTTRMGVDPTDSVVDAGLRTHEVRNLLALGAGAMPSCAPANPTLTLSALSLHAARNL